MVSAPSSTSLASYSATCSSSSTATSAGLPGTRDSPNCFRCVSSKPESRSLAARAPMTAPVLPTSTTPGPAKSPIDAPTWSSCGSAGGFDAHSMGHDRHRDGCLAPRFSVSDDSLGWVGGDGDVSGLPVVELVGIQRLVGDTAQRRG